MKRKLVVFAKYLGIVAFYGMLLGVSTFVTMSLLIKGDEIVAPSFVGKNLGEAYEIAASQGVHLKKIVGYYDTHYDPLTIIDQSPSPGTRVKERSFVKVFVTSEMVEVIMPDLAGHSLKEIETILRESDLRKRYVSYMEAPDVPVDFLIAQSFPAGARIPSGSGVDILISKGQPEQSFIMPDLIGKDIELVRVFFEQKGLKISKILDIPYPGLKPGIIIKQFPSSGFRINSKNLINLQVSR